jgi:hypothetical protein
MKALKDWLAGLLGPDKDFRPSYGVDGDPDIEAPPEEVFGLSPRRRQALRKFVLLACAHLGEAEASRLADVVLAVDASDPAEALLEGLGGDDGQRPGRRVLIEADWKAPEEIEWQAQEVADALRLDEQWLAPESDGLGDAQAMLDRLTGWLARRQHVLLQVDAGDDACHALVLPADHAERVIALARKAGLKVQGKAVPTARV